MRWISKSAVCVFFAVWAIPLLAANDDKPSKDKKDAADKMVASGKVTGKLIHWGSESKGIALQISLSVPNAGGLQTLANLQAQYVDASRDPNPVNRLRRTADIERQIAVHQKDAVKTENHDLDEIQPSEDMVVRWKNLPVVLDEKGKPKKLTEKEKKELKGDNPKLPGYTASKEDLRNDQIVTVYLSKKKDPKKDKEADKEKPVVTMIVIEIDPK
jgi:hypothetical protein